MLKMGSGEPNGVGLGNRIQPLVVEGAPRGMQRQVDTTSSEFLSPSTLHDITSAQMRTRAVRGVYKLWMLGDML